MNRSIEELFETLLKNTEIGKIDFKRDQYRLDTEHLKSELVKDILCIANAPGDDGYIVLGVKSEKGKPREITGISYHHDGADIAVIVNGVVDAPIQFEYHPLRYKAKECAIIHIPRSTGRPHWPRKDFGKLKKHVFYTRRASGNAEASIPEIRQMCTETMPISSIAKQKVKTSHHILDELATLSMDERKSRMYEMLKRIAPKVGLQNYRSIFYHHPKILKYTKLVPDKEVRFVLVGNYSGTTKREYSIFMYPWSVKRDNVIWSRNKIKNSVSAHTTNKLSTKERERLKVSWLIHIAYKNIYTSALQNWYYDGSLRFSNEMQAHWGKVMKWEKDLTGDDDKYEFFMPSVSSKEELQDRLQQMFEWIEKNLT